MANSKVSVIRANSDQVEEVSFESLRKGDRIFAGGNVCVVGEDAHISGDASYDGWLLYDEDGEAWFPEDLEKT